MYFNQYSKWCIKGIVIRDKTSGGVVNNKSMCKIWCSTVFFDFYSINLKVVAVFTVDFAGEYVDCNVEEGKGTYYAEMLLVGQIVNFKAYNNDTENCKFQVEIRKNWKKTNAMHWVLVSGILLLFVLI